MVMMCRNLILSLILLASVLLVVRQSDAQQKNDGPWLLSFLSDPLHEAGVPQLHEEIEEVLSDSEGLKLEPGEAFRWSRVSGAGAAFGLTAEVDGALYEGAVLTVWNWHNRAIEQRKIEPGVAQKVEMTVSGTGAYLITLDGVIKGECCKRLVRSLAVTENLNSARESWKDEEYFLGICAFPGRYHWIDAGQPTVPPGISEEGARELEAELIARLGFQVVRTDESMEMGRRSSGEGYQYNFDRMDAAVNAYTSRGFQLALQVMNAPDWAISAKYADRENDRWRYPREEDPQRHYLSALLDRYGEQARFIQIFNEPDQVEFWSGSQEEYVEHFDFSLDQIREDGVSVPVANGGYSLVDLNRTRFYAEQLKGKVDLPAYHSHGHLRKLAEDFAEMKQVHEDAGYQNPRYVNTETGQAGWRIDQERRMAQTVPQKTLFCWANDHEGILLFAGRMSFGPKRSTQDFGFLDYQFCPRFVYGTTAALVSVLDGASYEKTLSETDRVFAYQFVRGSDRILAAFTLEESSSITFRSDATKGVFVDEMGNRTAMKEVSDVTADLDGYPRYFVLENCSEVSLLPDPAAKD